MKQDPPDALSEDDVALVEEAERLANEVRDEIAKTVVGQADVVEHLLIALLAGGHALLEGVPGLAKTLLVSSIARALELDFKRIQFTPDLMPSDITGTEIIQENLETGAREYRFLQGPLFANLILADEINRTPPKTQAALLESMEERQVSAGGRIWQLPAPFFVLATQNPLDHEGTYPLPEAQLDRFLLWIRVDYPSAAEEWEIARRVTSGRTAAVRPVLSGERLQSIQELAQRVPVSDQALGYACALVRASRPDSKEAPRFVREFVQWGAGPRGVLAIVRCAKARALLYARHHASVEDVREVARPALRHRISGNYAAQASEMDAEGLVDRLLEEISDKKSYTRPSV